METTCQDSYPLNSENASPFGTFTVYLSLAIASATRTERNTATNTITTIALRFMPDPFAALCGLLRSMYAAYHSGQLSTRWESDEATFLLAGHTSSRPAAIRRAAAHPPCVRPRPPWFRLPPSR